MTKEKKIQIYNAIRVTPERLSFFSRSTGPGHSKYLINRHNCDTISNEPFIEPHFYNLEIGHQT